METIHLDPACDFVSIKSAESDGVDFDVAFKHYKECPRCRDYHMLTVQKADLFGLTIKKTLTELEAAEKKEASQKKCDRENNTVRLDLLMSYLGNTVEPVTVEYPYKHTEFSSTCASRRLLRTCAKLNTEAGDYEIYVTGGELGFSFRRGAKGAVTSCQSANEFIAALAVAIGKHRYTKARKK